MHCLFKDMLFLVEYVVQRFGIVDVEMFSSHGSMKLYSATIVLRELVVEFPCVWVEELPEVTIPV